MAGVWGDVVSESNDGHGCGVAVLVAVFWIIFYMIANTTDRVVRMEHMMNMPPCGDTFPISPGCKK